MELAVRRARIPSEMAAPARPAHRARDDSLSTPTTTTGSMSRRTWLSLAARSTAAGPVYAYSSAKLMVEILRAAGDNLTRENVLKQATSIKSVQLPMFRPGVIAQPLLSSRAAGVLFTRDPSSPWSGPEGALLEWTDWQGEAVAQGVGGTHLVRRREGAPAELRGIWAELWSHAWRCEEIAGAPCDVEWAWDGSRLWIVQARPIAGEEAALAARTRPGGRWTRSLTLERFPEADLQGSH